MDAVPAFGSEPPAGARPSVGRNAAVLLGSQGITAVLGVLLTFVQPRFLGPEGQGRLRLAASIWVIVEVLVSLGTGLFLTVEVARRPWMSRPLLRQSIKVRLIGYAAAWPFVLLFLKLAGYGFDLTIVAVITGVGSLFGLVASASRAALYGLQQMRPIGRLDVMVKILVVGATVTALILGFRVRAVASITVAAAVLSAFYLARAVRRLAPPARESDPNFPFVLRASVVFLITEASAIVYQQVDTVLMSVLADAKAIGYYAASDVLVASLLFVPTILLTAMFPEIARLHDQEPERLQGLLRRSFLALAPIGVMLGAGTILVADNVAVLLYGPAFAKTGPVLAVFGAVMTLGYFTILMGRFALATGRAPFWNRLMITGIVLTFPLDFVLIPWTKREFDNGALGGAIAFVVTEFVMVIAGILKLDRSLFDRVALTRYVKCMIAAAALLAAGWPLRDRVVVIPAAVGALAYVLSIVVLRTLSPDEKSMIKQLVSRLTKHRREARVE